MCFQITDVCVPISRLAEFVSRSEIDVQESGLLAPIVAHIGDGNVHRAILFGMISLFHSTRCRWS